MYVRVTNLCNNTEKNKRIHPLTVHLTAYLSLWKKILGDERERERERQEKEMPGHEVKKLLRPNHKGPWTLSLSLDFATNSSSRILHIPHGEH